MLWSLHPWRIGLTLALEIIRGLSPAFKGYSQALLINEVQRLIISRQFTCGDLLHLVGAETTRIGFEGLLDYLASSSEDVIHSSTQFLLEYKQMQQRVRLDVPTLNDPVIRDLLHESELFVRSFNGMSSFGLFSTFDLTHILSLISELVSHLLILASVTSGDFHLHALLLSLILSVLPLMLGSRHAQADLEGCDDSVEIHALVTQEKMHFLAYSNSHRPELALFGLGPWILQSWAQARKTMLKSGRQESILKEAERIPSYLISNINISGLLFVMQNIPLLLATHSPSASLGNFLLYRNSIESLLFTIRRLLHAISMAYQNIFLMAAFCAASSIKPRLHPDDDNVVQYKNNPGGMSITARNLTYTYPGSTDPAVKDVNITINAGESIAIVGFNGSGKSTLAKILLRILDHDSGELLVNDIDIRRYWPEEFHAHVSAAFQDFSKYDASVRENIAVGFVEELQNNDAVESAVHLAGAAGLVRSLAQGLETELDFISTSSRSDTTPWASPHGTKSELSRHGLSGGEWQRIALSRAFMRANRPEVDLILFDEPTSSLDAHAQKRVFDSLQTISRPASGAKKTVIYITHRLSTARHADKIVMMDKGTIVEFGTHEELLTRNGQYASLYKASV